jgi:hypothetical protein
MKMLGRQSLQARLSGILLGGDRTRSASPGRCDPACETDPRRIQVSPNVATRFRVSTWGSFCLRPAALRSSPAQGGDCGSCRRTVRRSRCPSGDGGCLCVDRGSRPQTAQGNPNVFDHDPGSGETAGLAHGDGRHACRHGEHRRLLEAGPCHPGRPRRADCRQCPPYPQWFRAQGPETGARPM